MSSLMPIYNRVDLSFDRGDGARLFATNGRAYLDFGSGVAVTALGHNHPHLVQALQAALQKPWHVSNIFTIPDQERLGERLVANSFADVAFFCNSGAEAVEATIKLTRKRQADLGRPERYRMITLEGAFHGRTLATIAAGGQEKYIKGFGPKVDGFDQVAYGNLNELRAAITPFTAGILCEPVQGEGGVRPMDDDYLRALRQICDEFGLLLAFDEIQCGMGRTGKLFAHQWSGVTPDVMALAKGLGGGFPIGACLATKDAASGMVAGAHGTTFGGNPLAMAAGNAVLDVMLGEGFLDRVGVAAERLWAGLGALVAQHPQVYAERRGRGLMLGLKCVPTNGEVGAALREAGLLTIPAGDNVVRLLPPLTVTDADIDEALSILDRVAAAWPAA